jgi:flagellin
MPKKGPDAAGIEPAAASKGTQKKEARPGEGPQIHASNKENPMSLGVLNNLNAIYAENSLNNTSNSLSKVLNQLSSGSKINSGADDAAGLSLVNGLQANSTALTQSETNATEGVGLLTVADGALSQVTSLLNRAVTLATEASNGTLNSTQDTAANQEYQSILSEISNIGSTTTYNQETVFGSKTNIYTGDSSTTGSSINSLNITSLSSSNVGDTSGVMSYSNGSSNVFINLSNTSSGKNAAVTDSLGAPADTTTIAVAYMTKGANGSAVSATANISVGAGTSYANTAQGLISAINGSGLGLTASFGTAAQAGTAAVAAANASTDDTTATSASTNTGIIISGAGIGSGSATTGADGAGEVGTVTLTAATSGAADSATLSGTLSIVGSDGKTHNITLGTVNSTDTLANLASTINAAGYGVTATYNAAPTATSANIVFTSANSGVTVSQTSLTSTATTTALAGTPTASGTSQTTTLGTISGAATATGSLTFGTSTVSWTGAQTLIQLAAIINTGNYGVSASLNTNNSVMTITSANSALPALTAGTANGLTSVAGGTTSEQYYGIGITGTVADSSTSAGTATVGITADNNGTGGVATISYSDAAGQSLSNTDLSNQTNAQAALTALNTAISDVAAQDGYIGAQINTLNSVSSVLSTQSENVTSAQNAVQATDYASATSNMSKYEILSQTGIAALAQANSIQQEVTKLLQ